MTRFSGILCSELKNRFFVLRHGQSEANLQGLIASSPDHAIENFGLTNQGRCQVADSVDEMREQLKDARIFTSDFKRTRETAELAGELLGMDVHIAQQIRERWFGELDGTSNDNYSRVWLADASDPRHEKWEVESVFSVATRMNGFVRELDDTTKDQTYLLVSHGDPLQILMTSMLGHDLGLHRCLDPPLETAALRPLC